MNRQEQIEAAIDKYTGNSANYLEYSDNDPWDCKTDIDYVERAFIAGVEWADANPSNPYKDVIEHMSSNTYRVWKENLWHDAQGDDLPEIDRKVIVLRNNGQIAFGHRPNPDGEVWKHPDGTLEHVYFKTYDKGEWSIPNVKWWLDVALPKGGGEE
jgi:hypothetical protein